MAITVLPNASRLEVRIGRREDTFDQFVRTSNFKTISVNNRCSKYGVYLTWLNSKGAWNYWFFEGRKNDAIDITSRIKTSLAGCNKRKEYVHGIEGKKQQQLRAELLSEDEAFFVSTILSSIEVEQFQDNITTFLDVDTRTIIVNTNSLDIRQQGDKLINITITVEDSDYLANQSY